MAAPTPTPRGIPTATKLVLSDGFPTKITFSYNLTLAIWEKMVTPAGFDGGEAIPTTTMLEASGFRTFRARHLQTLTPNTAKFAFSPDDLLNIQAMVNKEQTITETYPDGSTRCYYGYLQKFVPDQFEEGKQPEATGTIVPTNWDVTNNVGAGPALSIVTGT